MNLNSAVSLPSGAQLDEFAGQISCEIMDKCEKRLIYKITENEFPYAPSSDKREIYNIALKNASPENDDILGVMHYNRRKALIKESALNYLKENNYMIISGFVNFRLDEYKNELRKLCHNAADEFSAMREYDEFLNMLRFFVSVQMPKEPLVHVIKKNDTVRILNKYKKDITDVYSNEFAFSAEDFTHEDIALSALITISPKAVIIHDKKENDKIYETIAAVFPNVEFR